MPIDPADLPSPWRAEDPAPDASDDRADRGAPQRDSRHLSFVREPGAPARTPVTRAEVTILLGLLVTIIVLSAVLLALS